MLGRLRRTSRTDVALATIFVGLAYLFWALVAGASRSLIQEMIKSTYDHPDALTRFARAVKIFFVDAGFAVDLVGLAWLAVALLLVALASRQRISVSWAWVAAITQSFVAGIGAIIVGWAAYNPHLRMLSISGETPWEKVSAMSLPVILVIAVLIWVTFLVWLLVERARMDRRGPTTRDGLRTNVFR